MKDDFTSKAAITRNNYEKLAKEVLEPLNFLVQEQKEKLKVAERIWANAEKEFADKKLRIEEGKAEYLTAHRILDEAVEKYEGGKEVDSSPDRKKRESTKISELLKNCKDTEKTYLNLIYDAKNARVEYIKTMVILYQ